MLYPHLSYFGLTTFIPFLLLIYPLTPCTLSIFCLLPFIAIIIVYLGNVNFNITNSVIFFNYLYLIGISLYIPNAPLFWCESTYTWIFTATFISHYSFIIFLLIIIFVGFFMFTRALLNI